MLLCEHKCFFQTVTVNSGCFMSTYTCLLIWISYSPFKLNIVRTTAPWLLRIQGVGSDTHMIRSRCKTAKTWFVKTFVCSFPKSCISLSFFNCLCIVIIPHKCRLERPINIHLNFTQSLSILYVFESIYKRVCSTVQVYGPKCKLAKKIWRTYNSHCYQEEINEKWRPAK